MSQFLATPRAACLGSFPRHPWHSLATLAFFIGAAVAAQLIATPRLSADSYLRPNIILIMADDLGVECLGCYGGRSYETPAIDKLARQGMRFTHAYAQPLCTNTRVQLMTGLYNHRNWIAFGILAPSARTIGHRMRDADYMTGIFGKWQLRSYDPPDYPGAAKRRNLGMPVERAGFQAYSLWHTGHTELKGSRYADPVISRNGQFIKDTQGKYGPDLFVADILNYLTQHQEREAPFFIYYPMALPHWPFVPTPRSEDWKDPAKRHAEDYGYFKDMVESMDECVGRIVDHVDRLGLARSTLILFYSDNGTHLKVTSQTDDGPVQGGKGMTTDAGTHVPLIARWTGTIEPGSVNDDLIDSTDFLPTLREAARKPIEANVQLDGRSFYPQLLGQPGEPREWIFCHFDPRPGWDKDRFRLRRFARTRRYKLYDDGQMYDIPQDRLEQHPLPPDEDSPERAAVRRKLNAVLADMER